MVYDFVIADKRQGPYSIFNKKAENMKKIILLSICILVSITLYHSIQARCTVGVVAGEASFDGRPIAFKNRDYDFAYQGVVYVSSGTYKYIGIGNAGSSSFVWSF